MEVDAGEDVGDVLLLVAVRAADVDEVGEEPLELAGARPLRLRQLAERGEGLDDVPELPDAIVEELKARSYPGNVRELRNVVQAWAALGSLPQAEFSRAGELERLLADLVDVQRPYGDQKEHVNDVFTHVYLQALLAHTKGNQTQAAKLAGLDRSYLGRLLVKHGLSRP